MINSDAMLNFIAGIIEGDPDIWGVSKQYGKNQVVKRFVLHLSQHTEPLTNGKTLTLESIGKWIKYGKERAEAETARRGGSVNASASGRSEAVPEVEKVWFQLVQFWNDFNQDKPRTFRYTTPPAHLVGKVALEYDKSVMIRIGREVQSSWRRNPGRGHRNCCSCKRSRSGRKRTRQQRAFQTASTGSGCSCWCCAREWFDMKIDVKRFQMGEQRAKMDLRWLSRRRFHVSFESFFLRVLFVSKL